MENKGGKTLQFKIGPRIALRFGGDEFQQFGLKGRFILEQFHFHWGDANGSPGSEHALNGLRTSAEVHFVFYNAKYDNISNAVTFSDGIAVLGIMLQSTDSSPTFPEAALDIQSQIIQVPRPGNSTTYRRDVRTLISTMKIALSTFVAYQGGLTTPTCDESVTFLISQKVYRVTTSFLTALSTSLFVSETCDNMIVNNFRPLQPRNGREVIDFH